LRAEPGTAQVTVRKHPVSIAFSNRVLEKIDKEASKQKRSRSEFIELHFETLFFVQQELEN
jgi:metal-responsive CopG/Arc/MetJ family transcriptional regulator